MSSCKKKKTLISNACRPLARVFWNLLPLPTILSVLILSPAGPAKNLDGFSTAIQMAWKMPERRFGHILFSADDFPAGPCSDLHLFFPSCPNHLLASIVDFLESLFLWLKLLKAFSRPVLFFLTCSSKLPDRFFPSDARFSLCSTQPEHVGLSCPV